MPQADRAMDPILDELRSNFDRALSLDVKDMTRRLAQVEDDNKTLRSEVDELKQAVDLLRRIASDHEGRLRQSERAPAAVVQAAVTRG